MDTDYLLLRDEPVDCNTINKCLYKLHTNIQSKINNTIGNNSPNIPEYPYFKDGDTNYVTSNEIPVSTSGVAGVVERLFSDDISRNSFKTYSPNGLHEYSKQDISNFAPTVGALFSVESNGLFSTSYSNNKTFEHGEKSLISSYQPTVKYNSFILYGDVGIAFGSIKISKKNSESQKLSIKLNIIDDLIVRNNIHSIRFLAISNGYASGINHISEDLDMVSEINSVNITYLTEDDILLNVVTKSDGLDKINVNTTTYRVIDDIDGIDSISLPNDEYILHYFCIFKTKDMINNYTFDDWCFYITQQNKTASNLISAVKWAYHASTETFDNFECADSGYIDDKGVKQYNDSITNANDAFNNCFNATFNKLNYFSSNMMYADRMFKNCSNAEFNSLNDNDATSEENRKLKMDNLISAEEMFSNCTEATFSGLRYLIFPNSNNLQRMFSNCSNADFNALLKITVGGDCSQMFYNCKNAVFDAITQINGSFYSIDAAFKGCNDAVFGSLSSIESSIKNGSKLISADSAFSGLENATFSRLTSIFADGVEYGVKYDGTSMFEGCESATFDNLNNIGLLYNGTSMFKDCINAKLSSLVKNINKTNSNGTNSDGTNSDDTNSDDTNNDGTNSDNTNSDGTNNDAINSDNNFTCSVEIADSMFENCRSLNISGEYLSFNNLKSATSMFKNSSDIKISSLPQLISAKSMFWGVNSVELGKSVEKSKTNIIDATNMCSHATTVKIYTVLDRLIDATNMCSNCEDVYISEIAQSVTDLDESFANSKEVKIGLYNGNKSHNRYASNAFYKCDNVLLNTKDDFTKEELKDKDYTLGNISAGYLYDASQMFYNVKHLVLNNPLVEMCKKGAITPPEGEKDYTAYRYGYVKKIVPYSVSAKNNAENDDNIITVTKLSNNTDSINNPNTTEIHAELEVGEFEYYVTLYNSESVVTKTISKDNFSSLLDTDIITSEEYGSFAVTSNTNKTEYGVVASVVDVPNTVNAYELSATKNALSEEGGGYEWDIEGKIQTSILVGNITVTTYEGESGKIFKLELPNSMTFEDESYKEQSTYECSISNLDIELSFDFVINNKDGNLVPTLKFETENGVISFTITSSNTVRIYKDESLILLPTDAIDKKKTYIYDIIDDNENEYHLLYVVSSKTLSSSFLFSHGKSDSATVASEISNSLGNIMSMSVVEYGTNLDNDERKTILTIDESDLDNNKFGIINADRMFYNVKSKNLFDGYYTLISKQTRSTNQMFKINLDKTLEEPDVTTQDSADDENTFALSGPLFKDMDLSNISSAREMFKNRTFANEFPFYYRGDSKMNREASLHIPNGLINGEGMFEGCVIKHSEEFRQIGDDRYMIYSITIPPTLRYADRMFKDFNSSETKSKLQLGNDQTSIIYFSDNLHCDEMFKNCKFNNDYVPKNNLTLSLSSPEEKAFIGSDFSFSSINTITFRKKSFADIFDNTNKFFTDNTTFKALTCDPSLWFNEGVQLITVLGLSGNEYRMQIGVDKESNFKNGIMNISNKKLYDLYYSKLINDDNKLSLNKSEFTLSNVKEICGNRISCMFNPSMLIKCSKYINDKIEFKTGLNKYSEIYDLDNTESITLYCRYEEERDQSGQIQYSYGWRTVTKETGTVEAEARITHNLETSTKFIKFPVVSYFLGDDLSTNMSDYENIVMEYNENGYKCGTINDKTIKKHYKTLGDLDTFSKDDNISKSYKNVTFDNLKTIAPVDMPYAFSGLAKATFKNLEEIRGGIINGYGAFEYDESATFEKLRNIEILNTVYDEAYSNTFCKDDIENTKWIGNFTNMFRGDTAAKFSSLERLLIYAKSRTLQNGDVFNYFYDTDGSLVVYTTVMQNSIMKFSCEKGADGQYIFVLNPLYDDENDVSLISFNSGIKIDEEHQNNRIDIDVLNVHYKANDEGADKYEGADKDELDKERDVLTVIITVTENKGRDEEKTRFYVINNLEQLVELKEYPKFTYYDYNGIEKKTLRYVYKSDENSAENRDIICKGFVDSTDKLDDTQDDGIPVYNIKNHKKNDNYVFIYANSRSSYGSDVARNSSSSTSATYRIKEIVDESSNTMHVCFSNANNETIVDIDTKLLANRYSSTIKYAFYESKTDGNINILVTAQESSVKKMYYFLTSNNYLQESTSKPFLGNYILLEEFSFDKRLSEPVVYCDNMFDGCTSLKPLNLTHIIMTGNGSCNELFNNCFPNALESNTDTIKLSGLTLPKSIDDKHRYRGVFKGCRLNYFDFSLLNPISTNIHNLAKTRFEDPITHIVTYVPAKTNIHILFEGALDNRGKVIEDITLEKINKLTGLPYSVLRLFDTEKPEPPYDKPYYTYE